MAVADEPLQKTEDIDMPGLVAGIVVPGCVNIELRVRPPIDLRLPLGRQTTRRDRNSFMQIECDIRLASCRYGT